MPENVLYFPRLSLPRARWVNQAVLFFGQIGVIAPNMGSRLNKLFDARTRLLVEAGIVRPIVPDAHFRPDFLQPFCAAADPLMVKEIVERSRELRSHGAATERIHVGKFEFTPVFSEVARAGLMRKSADDPDWYETPKWIADRLMAYVALQIASSAHPWRPEDEMDLVTSKGDDWTAMTGRPENSNEITVRMRAVTSLLEIPDDVPVKQLIGFRQRHWRELKIFRELVEGLAGDGERGLVDDATLDRRLNETAQARDQVHALLREQRLARGDRLASFSVAGAPVAGAVLDAGAWSAFAGIGALLVEATKWSAERDYLHRALRSPIAYAAILKDELRPPIVL